MLAAALLAEVPGYLEARRGEVTGDGRRLVVRNGFHESREVTTAAGAVRCVSPGSMTGGSEVTGERKRFVCDSAGVVAEEPRVADVPMLYLHGLSSSDFGSALEQFLGSDAGLSAATITRLTTQCQDEARAFNTRRWPRRTRALLGRGHPFEGQVGAGQGVPAGHRRPRRRPQRAGRADQRVHPFSGQVCDDVFGATPARQLAARSRRRSRLVLKLSEVQMKVTSAGVLEVSKTSLGSELRG